MRNYSKPAVLLVVDFQNDFCPGGALGVKEADKLVPKINKYIGLFEEHDLPVLLTRDWHPARTKHFKAYGGIWPRHCVMRTKGARFHPGLQIPSRKIILSKGMDPQADGYSAFDAEDKNGLPLLLLLEKLKVENVFLCGLATDYCVKSSVLDKRSGEFRIFVLEDAVKGVNLKARDSMLAINEMKKKGAEMVDLKRVRKILKEIL